VDPAFKPTRGSVPSRRITLLDWAKSPLRRCRRHVRRDLRRSPGKRLVSLPLSNHDFSRAEWFDAYELGCATKCLPSYLVMRIISTPWAGTLTEYSLLLSFKSV
jgi:hypothetical protein